MPRYTPAEKNQRSLEFEARVLEVVLNLTGDCFKFTRYQPSQEILEIKSLAEKRLRVVLRYKTKSEKRMQKDNKAIFDSCNKKNASR